MINRGMAPSMKPSLVAILTIAFYAFAMCNAAPDSSTWVAKYARAAASSACPKKCRDEFNLCIEKVAKTKEEQLGCGRIFVYCYPSCFFPDKENVLVDHDKCTKNCWTDFGGCTSKSKTVGEQFTCNNFNRKCIGSCSASSDRKRSISALRKAVQLLVKERAEHLRDAQENKRGSSADLLALVSMLRQVNIKRDASSENTDQAAKVARDDKFAALNNQLASISADLSVRHKKMRDALAANPGLCDIDCQGFYDACRTQVESIADHITCVESKSQCMNFC